MYEEHFEAILVQQSVPGWAVRTDLFCSGPIQSWLEQQQRGFGSQTSWGRVSSAVKEKPHS